MEDGCHITGNIITAYLRTLPIPESIYCFQPYIYQKILNGDPVGFRRYVPQHPTDMWLLPDCSCKHWTPIVVDHNKKQVIQMDTLKNSTTMAQREMLAFNDIGVLTGYSTSWQQPILQKD